MNYKIFNETLVQQKDGKQHVQNSVIGLDVDYHGDYDFHKIKKKLFPLINKSFLKNIRKKNNPTPVFTAHTFIEPNSACLGLYYNHLSIDQVVNSIDTNQNKTYVIGKCNQIVRNH